MTVVYGRVRSPFRDALNDNVKRGCARCAVGVGPLENTQELSHYYVYHEYYETVVLYL